MNHQSTAWRARADFYRSLNHRTPKIDRARDLFDPGKDPLRTIRKHHAAKDIRFVPREDWAQYSPKLTGHESLEIDRTPFQPYNKITLHHTGWHESPLAVESLHRGKLNSLLLKARDIWGGEPYNSADVGYDFMISKHGNIYQGRNLGYEGAHVAGHNTDNIGIAFLGDYTSRKISGPQLEAYRRLSENLNSKFAPKGHKLPVYSHGYFSKIKDAELRGARKQLRPLGVIFDQPDTTP